MKSGTILDAFEEQQPAWYSFRRRISPTALQLATAALEECRRETLHHKGLQEYHAAMAKMLKERDVRLQQDIARLSQPLNPEQPT